MLTNAQLEALKRSGGPAPHDVIDQAIEANALRAELATAKGLLGEVSEAWSSSPSPRGLRQLASYVRMQASDEDWDADRFVKAMHKLADFCEIPHGEVGKCPTCKGKGFTPESYDGGMGMEEVTINTTCPDCSGTDKANARYAEREKGK